MQIQACVKQVTDSLNGKNQEGRTGTLEAAFAVPSVQMPYVDRTVNNGTLMLIESSKSHSHCGIRRE
jgi:hypothetical protein